MRQPTYTCNLKYIFLFTQYGTAQMKFNRKIIKSSEPALFPELSGGDVISSSLALIPSVQLYKTFYI